MALSTEEAEMLARLKGWHDRIEACLRLATAKPVTPSARAEAHAEYAAIKQAIAAEHRRMSTERGERALTEAERHWYQRAVHGAYAQLKPAVSSTDLASIRDALYGARVDFGHAISGLHSLHRGE